MRACRSQVSPFARSRAYSSVQDEGLKSMPKISSEEKQQEAKVATLGAAVSGALKLFLKQ